jgi:hypothetical protein
MANTTTAVKAKATTKSVSPKNPVKKVPAKKPVLKKVAKTTTTLKKEMPLQIKYEDKSAGQPEMVEIFYYIEQMLKRYDKKRSLVFHNDKPSQAHLVSHKPVEIDGKKRNELWFASALVQKGYVGFYYSPRYVDGGLEKHFSDAFVKCLKGNGCFYIKKNDPALMAEIEKAIKLGYEGCVKKGWI